MPVNPAGAPIKVFDDLRTQCMKNRAQFYKDITLSFYDCIKAFSETNFTEDLKKFDVPTLLLHSDDDQIVPIGAVGAKERREGLRVEPLVCHYWNRRIIC